MEPFQPNTSFFPVLLSGDRGSGKSTLCVRLLKASKEKGITAGGVICPGMFDATGEKTGCLALDAKTGQEMKFGSKAERLDGPQYRAWSFSEKAIAFANDAVTKGVDAGSKILFMDEIGPLEMEGGGGLSEALKAVLSACRTKTDSPDCLAVICVRPSLEGSLAAMFAMSRTFRLDGKNDSAELAYSTIMAMVRKGKMEP